jgi:hypothetical protein
MVIIIPNIKVILYIITSTGASPHESVEQQPPKLGLLATLSALRDEKTVHIHATMTSVIKINNG